MGRPIDEEDAINAILREYNTDDSDYPTDYQLGLSAAKKIIEELPSAQQNLQQSCNQLATDCISRQAAIDALEKWESESTWDEWCYDHKDEAEKYSVISPSSVVFDLPSAHPEPDTRLYSDGFCDGYKQGIKDAQSKIVCCKDCKYFETDYWVNSILTHEICAICECAVKPDGYCFMAERREG